MSKNTLTAIGLGTATLRKSDKALTAPKQLGAIDHIAIQVKDVAQAVG